MQALNSITACQLALEQRSVSSEEIVRWVLNRIDSTNNAWHIFASTLKDSALQAGADSDNRRRHHQTLGPLDGVPIAVKDNLHIAGYPTYAGTNHPFSTGQIADAQVVANLKIAGAIIVGKCTMDEGALGVTTNNPYTGQCINPVNPTCTPGGSSGGSAAAVAADIVPASLGTDTMGSVRIPAANCGLWGLKPTQTLVDRSGLIPLSQTFDTIGPLTHNVDDLAVMMQAIVKDDKDWKQWQDSTEKLNTVRIAVPDLHELTDCSDDVEAGFVHLTEELSTAGCQIDTVNLNLWDPGKARRDGLLISEAEAGEELAPLFERYPERFTGNFRRMIMFGTSATEDRLAKAHQQLHNLRTEVHTLLNDYDAMLMPTTPQPASPLNAEVPGNQADFCALANFADCPAIAFPVPGANGAREISVQLMGPAFSDSRLLGLARLIALRN